VPGADLFLEVTSAKPTLWYVVDVVDAGKTRPQVAHEFPIAEVRLCSLLKARGWNIMRTVRFPLPYLDAIPSPTPNSASPSTCLPTCLSFYLATDLPISLHNFVLLFRRASRHATPCTLDARTIIMHACILTQ
jgi:hypothetical protein